MNAKKRENIFYFIVKNRQNLGFEKIVIFRTIIIIIIFIFCRYHWSFYRFLQRCIHIKRAQFCEERICRSQVSKIWSLFRRNSCIYLFNGSFCNSQVQSNLDGKTKALNQIQR